MTHLQRARSTFIFGIRPNMADFDFMIELPIWPISMFWCCEKLWNSIFKPIPESLQHTASHNSLNWILVLIPLKMALFEKMFFCLDMKILICGLDMEISDVPEKTSDSMWSPPKILWKSIEPIFLYKNFRCVVFCFPSL